MMNYLIAIQKDKRMGFWLSTVFMVWLFFLYPVCLNIIYKYLFTSSNEVYTGFINSLYITVFSVPVIIVICLPRIVQYINILLDIKSETLISERVLGYQKPELKVFDLHNAGIKKSDDVYYIWKVQNCKGKKIKMIYFKNVFSFVGKTIGHTYEVTYYKHSKVIVDVKKIK